MDCLYKHYYFLCNPDAAVLNNAIELNTVVLFVLDSCC